MAFLTCTFKSSILMQDASFNAIIPEEVNENIKTLYLLHGLSDNNTNWSRMTGIERYAKKHNLAVIMPNADRSFYTDMQFGRNYYTYISKEIIEYSRQLFKLSTKREDTFIAGLSMGGYGAFKIALRNPEIFEAAASLSGVLDANKHFTKISTWDFDKHLILGDIKDLSQSEENIKYLLDNFNPSSPKPRLYQACGTEDFLYEDNKSFREWIKDTDFIHKYEEGSGAHTWDFWDKYIEKAINFLMEG